ncbi:hypothetical protein QJS04_geneDACA003128 [Acorus gramineus]|uniref:Uncharacterized protein n=1 Tax=Acorus gramineus TaxID=55184 RepID=A0AAV9BXA4_ACOGR|nr:hypothetical protein QJS04_geneDACA003128 [Acorus gramineus]
MIETLGGVAGPDLIEDDGDYIDQDHDLDNDEVLESSMNKISIIPQQTLSSSTHQLFSGFGATAQMPARIRPCVSPDL